MAKNGKFNVKNSSGAYDQVYLETTREQVVDLDVMTGATASADGEEGLVPAPAAGEEEYFLRGDGAWAEVTDTKVTNTLARTTRAYVTGTTSATTSTGTQVFDTGVYLGTTAGELNATTFVGDLSGNATSATTAAKVGSATVGSGVNPIYLSGGEATASSSTVGSGVKPVYLSSGTITASSSTVGSASSPVYLSSGAITECTSITASTATTATKLGTSTVGSGVNPIYLSSGTATASSSTVGSGVKPVYLSSGTLTVSSSTVGSGVKPVYLSSGAITVSDSTVGSGIEPVYLSGGAITVSGSTVGTAATPVYLSSGAITACSYDLSDLQSSLETLAGSALTVAASSLASPGYLKLSNGFTLQWGDQDSATFPLTFTTVLGAQLTMASGDDVAYLHISSLSTTKISVSGDDGTERGNVPDYYWLAYGYIA